MKISRFIQKVYEWWYTVCNVFYINKQSHHHYDYFLLGCTPMLASDITHGVYPCNAVAAAADRGVGCRANAAAAAAAAG